MSALTLDRREYIAHMAQQQAEAMVATLEDVSWRDDADTARELLSPAAREWRGIAKACQRERARCAALKHRTT